MEASTDLTGLTEDLGVHFSAFLDAYKEWRVAAGLPSEGILPHEICNAMTDKHGRICREVKHAERNDPRDEFPDSIVEPMAGFLSYMIMLSEYYGVDISSGIVSECSRAREQHSVRT